MPEFQMEKFSGGLDRNCFSDYNGLTMENKDVLESLCQRFEEDSFAFSYCRRQQEETLKWIKGLGLKRIPFDPKGLDVLYSPIRKNGVPFFLGYYDSRVYFSANSYRPRKPSSKRITDADIEYGFRNGKLVWVKSGNLYQIDGNDAFSFNEFDKFQCGSRYDDKDGIRVSVFIDDGGTTIFRFLTDEQGEKGILISLFAFGFEVSEMEKRKFWREQRALNRILLPFEEASSILKEHHPFFGPELLHGMKEGYQGLLAAGWKLYDAVASE